MTSLTENTRNDRFNDDLPLVQADIRVSLDTPLRLKLVDTVKIFEAVTKIYPNAALDITIESIPGIMGVDVPPGETDMVAFSNENLVALIHRNMLGVRWLKTQEKSKQDYPGYENMRSALSELFSIISELYSSPLRPFVVNMSYLNFIDEFRESNSFWFLSHPGAFSCDGVVASLMENIGTTADGIEVRMRVDSAYSPEKTKGYLYQNSAGTYVQPDSDLGWEVASDACHTALNKYFDNQLSEEAKEKWHRK